MTEPLIREDGVVDATARASSSRRLIGPAALVSVAFLGANALAYVFTVLAARLLAPAAFGELAALLGVLLVGTVPATGLQTAAALLPGRDRRAAARPPSWPGCTRPRSSPPWSSSPSGCSPPRR